MPTIADVHAHEILDSRGIANAAIIKPNQIGTLSETLEAIRIAREAGYGAVMAGRSGETATQPPSTTMTTNRSLDVTEDDHAASRRMLQRELEEYHLAESWVNPRDGSLMRLVPSGDFTMGSSRAELEVARRLDRDSASFTLEDETPQFRLLMPSYYLSVYAVTNAQFVRFLNEIRATPDHMYRWAPKLEHIVRSDSATEPYLAERGYEQHPVIHVSPVGAEAYCEWAGLRLPREIEWEKAARGSDARLFPWGDEWHDDYVPWHREIFAQQTPTAPVDAFAEGCSPYGLFQMTGNVEQWCSDPYRPEAYRDYARGVIEPRESGRVRVVRGGACVDQHKLEFRCAMRRARPNAHVGKACVGFRCACGELKWTRTHSCANVAKEISPAQATPSPARSDSAASSSVHPRSP